VSDSNPIHAFSVPDVLKQLSSGSWLVPPFQRDFVWDVSAIQSLATSILDGYPIGMMTLWDQSEEETDDHLEAISLPDWDREERKTTKRLFTNKKDDNPKAILDGRQRCTALAMLFGNFTQSDGTRKYAGRFFLDVTSTEPSERVVFKKKKELQRQNLTTDKACMSIGLYPLSPRPGVPITEQWLDYIEGLRDPSLYPDGVLPDEDELNRRRILLRSSYKGIFHSNVAVYVVPPEYDIGKICDIFETLNQTGVKVSTVDLIHSWILTETTREGDPLSVREWMDEASELEGAIGWISPENRPELTAQLVTACYVARESKPEPPRKSKGKRKEIASVKSPDLLNTPKGHWREVVQHQDDLANFLKDFQYLVAGGLFGYRQCPYPVSAAIYVAMRWHHKMDYMEHDAPWAKPELDALYKAFFWRNALSKRYDQGFLTQLGSDIQFFKNTLSMRSEISALSEWVKEADIKLTNQIRNPIPTLEQISESLLNGRPGGALQSAYLLPMLAACPYDIDGVELDSGKPLSVELHHIWPKKWCRDHSAGEYQEILDPKKGRIDFVNSIANLMPLSSKTNKSWRESSPKNFIEKKRINYQAISEAMKASSIDEDCFELLLSDVKDVQKFWQHRADLLAKRLLELTEIKL